MSKHIQRYLRFTAFVLGGIMLHHAQLNAQVVIRNSGNLYIAASGSLSVAGSFENSGASTDLLNSGTLQLTGDFTNNGNDMNAAGTGVTIFSGSATQNINGNKSTTFYDVTKPNTNSVVIALNEIISHSFTLTAGAFKLNDHILTLKGTITGTGVLTGTASSGLIVASTGALGTVLFDQTTDTVTNVLKSLTVSNGGSVILGNALNMVAGNAGTGYGTVTITGVTGILDANGNLTLKSNASGTAMIAQSTGKINNSVLVERYIPATRAWRFICVPFSSSTQSINAAWQEGAMPNPDIHTRSDPKPGYGTEITYLHNSQANGFDENTTANPSIRNWEPATNSWGTGITSTYSNILLYPAYYFFIRGNRQVDLSLATSAPPSITILRAKGVLNETGADVMNSFLGANYPASQRLFVGNPFAAPVNLLAVVNGATNIASDKFWVWNPADGSLAYPYNVGNYVSYDHGIMTPANSTYAGGTNVQNGQAFMVETTGGVPSLTFKQSNKITSQANVFGLQAANQRVTTEVPPAIYTNLLSPALGPIVPVDGVAAGFGRNYAAGVDVDDAIKMFNLNENLYLDRNGEKLCIELRPLPETNDTLFYKMSLYLQPYTLQIFSHNLPAGFPKAWLVDKYQGTQTDVNLYDTTLYSFTPNSDTNSFVNRFMLVFSPAGKSINANKPGGVKIKEAETAGVKIYPNPASAGSTMLQFGAMAKGSYEITVYNAKGEKLASRMQQHSGGSNEYALPLSPSWTSGVYTVNIINKNSGTVEHVQLVINR